jgi:hypothetical protein
MKNSYNFVGHIERDAQRFCYSTQLQIQCKVIEDRKTQRSYNDIIHNGVGAYSFDNSSRYGGAGLNLSHSSGLTGASFSSTFRVISTISPNCVSVSQIDIKGSKLYKTPLSQFIVDDGKVAGFDIHPSQDYILITSCSGKIYVYRIDTGELRGTINVP